MNVAKKDLLPALSQLLSLAIGKTTLPILSHFNLSGESGYLSIRATDLDAFQEIRVPGEGDVSTCCVSAKTLTALCQSGSDTISLALSGKLLTVNAGWTSELPVLDAAEWPSPDLKDLKQIGVVPDELAEAIRGVSWAALSVQDADKQQRQLLAGINVKMSAKTMSVAASCGTAASLFFKTTICSNYEGIIPIAYADAVADALIQPNAKLLGNDRMISVTYDNGSFSCKLVEGTFPNISRLVPEDEFPVGLFNREEMIGHIANCDVLDPAIQNLMGGKCRITFGKPKIIVSAASSSGGKYSAMMIGGLKSLECMYSTKLLKSALQAADGVKKISWMQKDSLSPGKFCYGDFTTVIMGMRLT